MQLPAYAFFRAARRLPNRLHKAAAFFYAYLVRQNLGFLRYCLILATHNIFAPMPRNLRPHPGIAKLSKWYVNN